ncbi:acyl-CoA Delta(11) desaturase-like isoform X1 [Maniola jurtina]|uniref:acyl-CoA Delta(11) desaturase-like isoform X1 n=1 Tax=Maniola jurtina TaxID=191418 RepID=UPI001E6863D9|nr:acyl-CoA Delta(11) desaturase-like isoform X1 [Maniola jurtina]
MTASTDKEIIQNQEDARPETVEDDIKLDPYPKLVAPQAAPREYDIIWMSVIRFTYGHLAAVYGLYLACTVASWNTLIFNLIVYILGGIGITAGAHRLWSHRAYKANTALQVLIMLMNSMAFQNTAFDWAKKHRLHHRYSDTDADPHNASRGFFFSHIGWLMVKRHPEVKRREHLIDLSDLYANPVLMFQKRYAVPVIGTVCFILPTLIPVYFFGETLSVAWHVNILRYICNLHMSFFINSAAHMWGNKPYDNSIKPVQNLFVSLVAFGEGFHNYHHTYPWDYKAAELGNNKLNLSTKFIDLFAWIGWARDLKTVPENTAHARMKRTGDGSDMWGYKDNE